MKILITTFAFALVVFAFNATPSYANEESNRKVKDFFTGRGSNFETWTNCPDSKLRMNRENNRWVCTAENLDELDDPSDAENKKAVADSGKEGSTSETAATEQ
ncbi:MAG: hypothetical protein OXF09_04775 [Hyphomicrobiales bacterium]|nr:hypothetical protein [Hyphomicrobiales bacterium]